MNRNKAIGIGLIALGVVLIFVIGGLSVVQKGTVNQYAGIPSGRGGMMEAGLSLGAPAVSDSVGTWSEVAPESKMMAVEPGLSADPVPAAQEKKVIKNGNLDLKVERLEEANQEIARIAAANGGEVFASNAYFNPRGNIRSGSATVKVPVGSFQKAFDELKKVATLVVSESTSGQDVTEAYTDLQSRLRNKQAEEASIAKILERTGDIDSVLKVTRELNRVRGEIELIQGQIRMMESQTDLATIFVSMTEDQNVTVVDSWRPWQLAKDSVNNLVRSFQRFVDFVIVLVISVLPILVLYFILIFVLYRIGKKLYLRWKTKQDQPPV